MWTIKGVKYVQQLLVKNPNELATRLNLGLRLQKWLT
jgi:hypothetical protein